MARRLFFVDLVRSGAAEIAGDDALHLTKVLRVEAGQRYEISDNDQLYLAEVVTARKQQVVFRVMERLPMSTAHVRLHLFAALIKFDHFEWMLEKATELGVERVTPVISERCEHGLERAAPKRMERWRRILKESAQQCRRWRMPAIEGLAPMKRVFETPGLRYLLDEDDTAGAMLGCLPEQRSAEDEVNLLIGPEGGWTGVERSAAIESGWRAVSLGPTILRTETAAIAALAVVNAAWQCRVSIPDAF